MGRGGGCFIMDFCRFPMDLGGCLARGFAFISLLSTRHFHPLAGSTLNLEPPRRFANRERYVEREGRKFLVSEG